MEARRHYADDINRDTVDEPVRNVEIPEDWDIIRITPQKGTTLDPTTGPALVSRCGVLVGHDRRSLIVFRLTYSGDSDFMVQILKKVLRDGGTFTFRN